MYVRRACKRFLLVPLVAVVGVAVIWPSQSVADTFTWSFERKHPRKVNLQVYSRARNQVWPAPGRVWPLNDFGPHTVKIDCVHGDKICFGAWDAQNDKMFWGKGHGGKKGCEDCCYSCSNGTGMTTIRELTLFDN
jgi:hypothetical protein